MSRIRNATDFLMKFRKIQDDYKSDYELRISKIRDVYAKDAPKRSSIEALLEAHNRKYRIDHFLSALNWKLDVSPENNLINLIPEVPILSEERKTTRFLDYLGLEGKTDNPLIIVEAKRPSAQLPPTAFEGTTSYSEIISRGLSGGELIGDWNGWLEDLRDYVGSVYKNTNRVPKRVVLTNGDWWVLFLDPSDAFLENGTFDSTRIIVFEDGIDIEKRFNEVFRYLEYGCVLEKIDSLVPGELTFLVDLKDVDRAMHGLRLIYIEQQGLYKVSPVLKVAPVIFLHSRDGTWLPPIEDPPIEYQIPHHKDDLIKHIKEVKEAAEKLFSKVRISLSPLPLSKHFKDEDSFESICGVKEYDKNKFLVVTGDKTHYLLPEPSVLDCPYHDWKTCYEEGVSCPSPVYKPSVDSRSFFKSGEIHHCAHRDVGASKASQITSPNKDRCGLRSGRLNEAFCEIWKFEQFLCCRICAFEIVCSNAIVFRLPCTGDSEDSERI